MTTLGVGGNCAFLAETTKSSENITLLRNRYEDTAYLIKNLLKIPLTYVPVQYQVPGTVRTYARYSLRISCPRPAPGVPLDSTNQFQHLIDSLNQFYVEFYEFLSLCWIL